MSFLFTTPDLIYTKRTLECHNNSHTHTDLDRWETLISAWKRHTTVNHQPAAPTAQLLFKHALQLPFYKSLSHVKTRARLQMTLEKRAALPLLWPFWSLFSLYKSALTTLKIGQLTKKKKARASWWAVNYGSFGSAPPDRCQSRKELPLHSRPMGRDAPH